MKKNDEVTPSSAPRPHVEQALVVLCRPGFETEACEELADRVPSEINRISVNSDQGYLNAMPARRGRDAIKETEALLERRASDLGRPKIREGGEKNLNFMASLGFVFVWDVISGYSVSFKKPVTLKLSQVSEKVDRITPIVETLKQIKSFGKKTLVAAEPVPSKQGSVPLRVTCPEGSQVPGLLKFCKGFQNVLSKALRSLPAHELCFENDEELVVFFESYESAIVALRKSTLSARLAKRGRVGRSGEAPSRSSSKLEEAFRFFEIQRGNHSGSQSGSQSGKLNAKSKSSGSEEYAVDLGAAPGGWTSVLLGHGYNVIAVDNGPLDASLKPFFVNGRLEHLEADAFHFVPDRPVSLVVCDVVDKPSKVTDLMVKWGKKRYASELVFNLKLPMKKRYSEVKTCLGLLYAAFFEKGFEVTLDAHQLYHDRQEITVDVCLEDRVKVLDQ